MTDVGDAAAIVGDTGWVVPPRCPHTSASAVLVALEARRNGGARELRRRAARESIVAKCSGEKMVSRCHAVWELD